MKIREFVDAYNAKKFISVTKMAEEKSAYLRQELNIKTYIPFRQKRQIAEMIVSQYTEEVDGIKKHDSINAFMGFVTAMIAAHTTLEFSDDPVADYDLLSESGLLSQIVTEFKSSYDECESILKMVIELELEDNRVNALVGRFLNKVSKALDDISESLKDKIESFDLKSILGQDIKQEDLAKLFGFLDKLK